MVDRDYMENWIEGMDVFHNPKALVPLYPVMLPGAVHHRRLDDGQVKSVADRWQPLASITSTVVMHDTAAGATSGRD